MNVNEYLKRISAEKENLINLDYLSRLQKKHMEKIPFENLDVTRKVEIKLDINRFFEKVMGRNRGGFCYELNGLFHHLLTKLGFRSHLIACTVNRPNGWAKEGSHAALLVYLDQPFLVDVGFGDSVRQPVPLTGEERTDTSGTYRVSKIEHGSYDLQRFESQDWNTLYRFTAEPKQLEDFTEGCIYNQSSPESNFTHGDIATIATEKGRITLSGLTVTRTENGKKEKFNFSEEEKVKFLQEHFHIKI